MLEDLCFGISSHCHIYSIINISVDINITQRRNNDNNNTTTTITAIDRSALFVGRVLSQVEVDDIKEEEEEEQAVAEAEYCWNCSHWKVFVGCWSWLLLVLLLLFCSAQMSNCSFDDGVVTVFVLLIS